MNPARWNRLRMALIMVMGCIYVAVLLLRGGNRSDTLPIPFGLVAFAVLAVHLVSWRCPKCGRLLPRRTWLQRVIRCRGCGCAVDLDA